MANAVFVGFVLAVALLALVSAALPFRRRMPGWTPFAGVEYMRGETGGVEYRYGRHPGGRHVRPYFLVRVPFPTPGAFEVVRQTATGRLLRRWRVCVEVETRDTSFDGDCQIETDMPLLARRVFSQPEARGAVRSILGRGFTSVAADRDGLAAVWNKFSKGAALPVDAVELTALDLACVGGCLPLEADRAEVSLARKVAAASVWYVPLGMLSAGVLGMMVGTGAYPLLDEGALALDATALSVPVWLATSCGLLGIVRHLTTSHRKVWSALVFPLVSSLLLCWGGMTWLNGAIDDSKPTLHRALVVDISSSSGKGGRKCYAHVESWRTGVRLEKIRVPVSVYSSLQPGLSQLSVTTRAGGLGHEWLAGVARCR